MEWKTIPSSQGRYEASEDGQIRNANTKRILAQHTNNKGYKTVYKIASSTLVSRLVAEAWIPNPENKPEVDHIDSNPANNAVGNLRWVTRSENLKNPHRVALIKEKQTGVQRGPYTRKTDHNTKSDAQKAKEDARYAAIKALVDQEKPVKEIAKEVGCSVTTIYDLFPGYNPSSRSDKYEKHINTIIEKLKAGKTMKDIAEELGINKTTGMKYMADRYYKETGIRLISYKRNVTTSQKKEYVHSSSFLAKKDDKLEQYKADYYNGMEMKDLRTKYGYKFVAANTLPFLAVRGLNRLMNALKDSNND